MSTSEAFSAFSNTRWSMVLRLRSGSEQERRSAFSELCQAYWKPVYTFARRLGQSPQDAEDLTQGFITQLIEREDLGPVSPEKGRLRTFIKTAFRHYLTDQYRQIGLQGSPTQRLGLPADIADVVAFLVSEEARWLTGQTIQAGGGIVM